MKCNHELYTAKVESQLKDQRWGTFEFCNLEEAMMFAVKTITQSTDSARTFGERHLKLKIYKGAPSFFKTPLLTFRLGEPEGYAYDI